MEAIQDLKCLERMSDQLVDMAIRDWDGLLGAPKSSTLSDVSAQKRFGPVTVAAGI